MPLFTSRRKKQLWLWVFDPVDIFFNGIAAALGMGCFSNFSQSREVRKGQDLGV